MNKSIAGIPIVISEKEVTNIGIEWVICFFCGKKPVKFVDGKGYCVLGERKNKKNSFGSHAGCDDCFPSSKNEKAPSPENA